MPIHNIEMHPNKGGQIARSAGCMATIVNKQEEHAIVRLPSGACVGPRAQPPCAVCWLCCECARGAWGL
jgi:ribosomal protein L2